MCLLPQPCTAVYRSSFFWWLTQLCSALEMCVVSVLWCLAGWLPGFWRVECGVVVGVLWVVMCLPCLGLLSNDSRWRWLRFGVCATSLLWLCLVLCVFVRFLLLLFLILWIFCAYGSCGFRFASSMFICSGQSVWQSIAALAPGEGYEGWFSKWENWKSTTIKPKGGNGDVLFGWVGGAHWGWTAHSHPHIKVMRERLPALYGCVWLFCVLVAWFRWGILKKKLRLKGTFTIELIVAAHRRRCFS